MRELTWDDFADAAGTTYAIEVGDDRVDLTLDRLEQLPHSPRATGAFRLEFLGPLERVLPQAIYPFSLEGEPVEIFIVPIAREAAGIRYEAVFF
jgi:hypothetical protein